MIEAGMTHYDEHTLELYLLNSSLVAGERGAIEAHLDVCRGCSGIVDELRDFHAGLAEELQHRPVESPESEKSLVRRSRQIEKYFEPFSSAAPYRPRGAARIVSIVRHHPVAAGSAALLAVAAALLLFLPRGGYRPARDTNPAFVRYNANRGELEVFNKEKDSVLWRARVNEAGTHSEWLDEESWQKVLVADLDEDGRAEVISTAREVGESQGGPSTLKIFSPEGEVRLRTRFEAVPAYRGRTYYSPHFDPATVTVIEAPDGRKEIIVFANNVGRSPSFVCRLNERGEVLGRYWHFGHLKSMLLRDLDGDGKPELLVGGQNDTPDTAAGKEFAVLIVLDPQRISGEMRAGQCAGYSLPPSNAEIAYIKFPRVDLNDLYKTTPAADAIETDRPHEAVVAVRTLLSGGNFDFHFYFDSTLAVTNVRSNGFTDQLYAEQVALGKLTGAIDDAYLATMRARVEYWDGRTWTNKLTRPGQSFP